jgi:hypothetical protein
MTRPLRPEFPGALYHISSAGDAREAIHRGDGDRRMFLDNLRRRPPNDRDLSEVPRAQRRPPAKPLTEYAARCADRYAAIAAAYASGG